MASFDSAMKNAVPGGDLATPIAVAAGALILGKIFGGGSSPSTGTAPPRPSTASSSTAPSPTAAPASDILGGLGALIGKLTAGGAGQQVNSWVGSGPNKTISQADIASALGTDTLDQLASYSGMQRGELLSGLSAHLPRMVDTLTPDGEMLSDEEAARLL